MTGPYDDDQEIREADFKQDSSHILMSFVSAACHACSKPCLGHSAERPKQGGGER